MPGLFRSSDCSSSGSSALTAPAFKDQEQLRAGMGVQTSLEISETSKIRAGISHLPKSGVLFILRVGPEASESIRAVSQAGLSVTC